MILYNYIYVNVENWERDRGVEIEMDLVILKVTICIYI